MTPKVILITGASSGIGEAAARLLLEKGNTVYAAARRLERMKGLEEAGARLVRMDVTDDNSMKEGVERILGETGRIDVLVNNAGYGYFGALENVSMEEARRQFEVNVFGLARMTQLALPSMRERGDGRIINVASMAGHFCEPHGDWYHATKYSVVALTECLRQEVRRFGVKVIKIEPGAITSEWSDIAMKHLLESSRGTAYMDGASRQSRIFSLCYGRFSSSPEKVARCICHAALSRRPRFTYRKGFGSSFMPFLKTVLPDRCFDALVARFFS
ncbi:MAG: oxidoreductase [Bacteroidales bacterium]|nr:oxidoreductase [Bacteroidales bacterium]